MIEANSPGKLVISGEYAVLDGAPAVSMATGVRAHASVSAAAGRSHEFLDRETGQMFAFSLDADGRFGWQGRAPGQSGRIVECVFSHLAARNRRLPAGNPMRVALNTDDFYRAGPGGRQKLGLGSSAAVLVALTAAIARWLGLDLDRSDLAAICGASHRAFQDGAGSGIDVVTSIWGGVVALQPDGAAPRVESLRWPEGLLVLPVWSGQSGSTPALLARHAAFRQRDPRGFATCTKRLTVCAQRALRAWQSGSAEAVLETAAACDAAMLELDTAGRIGIETEMHARLRAIAADHGATYKISGAGGGDFGLVLALAPEPVAALREQFQRMGLPTLAAASDAAGVTVSEV